MSATLEGTANAALPRRLWTYQRERFPLVAYLPLIGIATLSGAAFSRHARGAAHPVPWEVLGMGMATVVAFFFLLRVLDEHKDAAVDRRYRPELPVPRGLVTLSELRGIGGGLLLLVLLWNTVVAPALLWICLLVAGWAALMTREFFAPEWLCARPAAYLLSHMIIMPLIFGYVTALDWRVAGASPSPYLWAFLALAFLNGIVIEVGRKIRAPEAEREGVDSYTGAWGVRMACAVWLGALAGAAGVAWLAAQATGAAPVTAVLLLILLPAAALPAIRFLQTGASIWAARLEAAGGLWTLAAYLLLGAGPLLTRLIGI